MAEIRIEGKPVAGLFWDHLYLVYVDDNGNEFVIRGGQGGGVTTGFGNILVEVGVPIAQSLDERDIEERDARGSAVLDLGDRDAADVWSIMLQQGQAIQDAQVSYDLLAFPNQNSNSTVASVLHVVGIDVATVLPDQPWNIDDYPGYTNVMGDEFDFVLLGTERDDILVGDEGADTLDGGLGTDMLTGGEGGDIFLLSPGDDIVLDSDPDDRLYIRMDYLGPNIDTSSPSNIVIPLLGAFYVHDAGPDNMYASYSAVTYSPTEFVRPNSDGLSAIPTNLYGDGISFTSEYFTYLIDGVRTLDVSVSVTDEVTLETVATYSITINDFQNGDFGMSFIQSDFIFDIDHSNTSVLANSAIAYNAGGQFFTRGGQTFDLSNLANLPEPPVDVVGSEGVDYLTGGAGDDYLTGGAGDDYLTGGGGNDIFVYASGDGNDVIDEFGASSDVDTLLFSDLVQADLIFTRSAAVSRDLIIEVKGTGETIVIDDQFRSSHYALEQIEFSNGEVLNAAEIQEISWFRGGENDDVISGSADNDTLVGHGGSDTLSGLGGDDVLYGGAGDDDLNGGAGDDWLDGGLGADTLVGGAGFDTVDYWASGSAVTVDLSAGTGVGGDADGDDLSGIERIFGSIFGDTIIGSSDGEYLYGNSGNDQLYGGDGVDTLYGDDGFDYLVGGSGDDWLYGGAGNDLIVGGTGSDVIEGGAGNDTASYLASAAAVDIDLSTSTGAGGDAAGDTYLDIENLQGTLFGDLLLGDGAANILWGEAGDDELQGGSGDDQLLGGLGDDWLVGGLGADILSGGDGYDTADYSSATSAVVVNLFDGQGTGGEALGDVLSSIERLYGTDYGDQITGSDLDDELYGEAGADTIDGGAGDDWIVGGEGGDAIDGGGGFDSIDYWDSVASVEIDLLLGTGVGGSADGDTLQSIERVFGSNFDDLVSGSAGNDYLYGNDGADTLSSLGGNDFLSGDDGDDILTGGDGDDWIYGGSGDDTFIFTDTNGSDVIGDFEAGLSSGDTIQIQSLTVTSYTELQSLMSEANGDTTISFDADNSILLEGISISDFDQSDFQFI